MFIVTLNNSSGELDRREVQTDEQAAAAAIEMIKSAGALYEGDSIKVTETE